MAKCKGLLTPKEFKKRYRREVHSLKDAIKFAIEKYERLLVNWDKATDRRLYFDYIGEDTCALCRFLRKPIPSSVLCASLPDCDKCPLLLGCRNCNNSGHPWGKMSRNLLLGSKGYARRSAEKILRILKREAKKAK